MFLHPAGNVEHSLGLTPMIACTYYTEPPNYAGASAAKRPKAYGVIWPRVTLASRHAGIKTMRE